MCTQGFEHPALTGASLTRGGHSDRTDLPAYAGGFMAGQLQVSRGGTPIFVEDFLRNSNTSNQIARQTQKTLSQLSKTNNEIVRSQRAMEEHTARIAAATERQNDISLRQLAEAERQTAISEQQLEMAKIADLERRRQIELKQAAFALKEALATPHSDTDIQRFYNLYVSKGVVQAMELTADAAHEIADKEYVRDVLRTLEDEYSSLATKLGLSSPSEIEQYAEAKGFLSGVDGRINALDYGDSTVGDPGAFSVKDFVVKALYPIPLKHSMSKSDSQYERAAKMAQGKGISYDAEAAKERDRAKVGTPNTLGNVVFGPIWVGLVIWSGGLIMLGSALVYFLNRSINKDHLKKSQEKNAFAVAEHQRLTSDKAEAQQIVQAFENKYGAITVA